MSNMQAFGDTQDPNFSTDDINSSLKTKLQEKENKTQLQSQLFSFL